MDERNLDESGSMSVYELALRHFNVGNMKLDGGAAIEAATEYQSAIELWAHDARFYNNLGIAYRQTGELGGAEENLRKAIELDSQYRDAYSNLGLTLLDLEMYEEAVANFTIALAIDPNFWYAYNGRGLAYWALGKREEALSDYERLKSLR